MKVGISLSGGAARGLAHMGVLRELEKAKFPIDIIAGTSVGSVIGAMYALEPDASSVEKRVLAFLKDTQNQILPSEYMEEALEKERRGIFRNIMYTLKKSIFYGISLRQISLVSGEKLREVLSRLVPDVDFSECKIPFMCSATDITTSGMRYFESGSLLDAVVASCTIPGLFPPVEIDGRMYVDGSWSAQNPVRELRRMGADFVVAVDITQDLVNGYELSTGLDVVLRSNMATRRILSNMQLEEADFVIRPDTCNVNWWDFSGSAVCLTKGMDKTAEDIRDIKRRLMTARVKKALGLGKRR